MKKFFLLLAFLLITVETSLAVEPVQMAAPRTAPSATPSVKQPSAATKVKKSVNHKKATKKSFSKKTTRKHSFKKSVAKIDYNTISKMLEYGNFTDADKIINSAIASNPKDLKAKTYKIISNARQFKLDSAQKDVETLLKQNPKNSDLHYAQGIIYYQRTASSNMAYRGISDKLFADSLLEFEKAISLDKKNAKAYNAAGVVSIQLGKINEAKNYFQNAILQDTKYSSAVDNLGTIYLREKKYSEAESKFKQALTLNTQNTTAMYHLAQIEIYKKNYAQALFYLNNALSITPNSPAIYNLMGKAYAAQGNTAASIVAFKKSISTKPEFILSYMDLADLYNKRGDGELAIDSLNTAIAIAPDSAEAKMKLADAQLSYGKYKQATVSYEDLVNIPRYKNRALKGLAGSYYGLAQIDAGKAVLGYNQNLFTALENINKAIDANPEDLELHLAKLRLEKLTNQPDKSKVTLNKILNSKDTSLITTILKGEAYLSEDDYKNANVEFNKAIELAKTKAENLNLAEIFIYHRQFDNAKIALSKVLQNEPSNVQALNAMDYINKSMEIAQNYYDSGEKFLKSGKKSAAIEYFSLSLSINLNNAKAHLKLAQLYESNKNTEKALKQYKAYVSLEPNAKESARIKFKIRRMENKL